MTVDADRIKAIRLVNLSEAAAASYPLVTPSLDHIAEQILASQSLEGITCPQENKYTSQILLSRQPRRRLKRHRNNTRRTRPEKQFTSSFLCCREKMCSTYRNFTKRSWSTLFMHLYFLFSDFLNPVCYFFLAARSSFVPKKQSSTGINTIATIPAVKPPL